MRDQLAISGAVVNALSCVVAVVGCGIGISMQSLSAVGLFGAVAMLAGSIPSRSEIENRARI